jgi:hypothetical protein
MVQQQQQQLVQVLTRRMEFLGMFWTTAAVNVVTGVMFLPEAASLFSLRSIARTTQTPSNLCWTAPLTPLRPLHLHLPAILCALQQRTVRPRQLAVPRPYPLLNLPATIVWILDFELDGKTMLDLRLWIFETKRIILVPSSLSETVPLLLLIQPNPDS